MWHLREPIDELADGAQVTELLPRRERRPQRRAARRGRRSRGGVRPRRGAHREGRAHHRGRAGHTLVVGDKAPVGFRTYVRAADGGVAAVGGDLGHTLLADAQTLRDRHVLRFDPAAVREVRIDSPDGTLRVTGEGGTGG
ncbi:MAG: DUF4340 domain-containing protein [Myxococcota bacterium]